MLERIGAWNASSAYGTDLAGLFANPVSGGGGAAEPSASMGSQQATLGAVNRVFQGVSEMLQQVGGGVENDAVLRLLIAFMIISALLQTQQGDSASEAMSSLTALGGGRASQVGGQDFMFSYTSVQYSATSISMYSSVGSESGNPAPSAVLDVTA